MPRKTLGLAWPVTMDPTKGNWRLWCLRAVLGGAGGSGTGWQSRSRVGTWQLCHVSGALAGLLYPWQCLPAAKHSSAHASRAPSPHSRFVVITQITGISLKEEFRFYLQEWIHLLFFSFPSAMPNITCLYLTNRRYFWNTVYDRSSSTE